MRVFFRLRRQSLSHTSPDTSINNCKQFSLVLYLIETLRNSDVRYAGYKSHKIVRVHSY